MLIVQVNRNEPTPPHDQVAAEIRRAISEGEAGPGERLPLAKDLAAVLGVNKNTVLRDIHILRDDGLLDFQRGRGITWRAQPRGGRRSPDSRSHRVLPQPGASPR
jgi:GntR family transcriptional regulator